MAQLMYANDNHGYLIQAGLGHGGTHQHDEIAWFSTLQSYYQNKLVARCSADNSPHWLDEGNPVPPSTDLYRRTSYGINPFLDRALCPWGGPYVKLTQVRNTSATIQFLEMAYTGDFAASDHPHPDGWVGSNIPLKASRQVQIHSHSEAPPAWGSRSNWSFLDGHAETLSFAEVFTNVGDDLATKNRFDPRVAQ